MFKGYLIREKVRGKAILRCEYSTNRGNKRSSPDRYLFKCTLKHLFFSLSALYLYALPKIYMAEGFRVQDEIRYPNCLPIDQSEASARLRQVLCTLITCGCMIFCEVSAGIFLHWQNMYSGNKLLCFSILNLWFSVTFFFYKFIEKLE